MHTKDFDIWNNLKKKVDGRTNIPFANQRDIWWCSLGINVGSEEDGKNELFERPVLVLKVFSKTMLRVAPLTSKERSDTHHIPILYNKTRGSVILSQIKTISTKRLSRKLTRLDAGQFQHIINKSKECF